jgi:hypothetical protein
MEESTISAFLRLKIAIKALIRLLCLANSFALNETGQPRQPGRRNISVDILNGSGDKSL